MAADATYNVPVQNRRGGTELNIGSGGTLDVSAGTLTLAAGQILTAALADLGVTTAKINDLAVTAAKLAADAVTTAKILDANVTTGKLASGAATLPKVTFTGIKVLAAAGRNGAGAITLTGSAVTDRVIAVFGAPTAGGTMEAPAAGTFEAAITVVNQIQQVSASDLSTKTYIYILVPAAS